MQLIFSQDQYVLSASDLVRCILRTDLVPVPSSVEFIMQDNEQTAKQARVGNTFTIGDFGIEYTIIKVIPMKTQIVKDNRTFGGFSCTAVPKGCERLIEAVSNAVIMQNTSFNAVYRACGAKVAFNDDIPLGQFVCLKGSIPTMRIAVYLQQEAGVIAVRDGKLGAFKINSLLKQQAKAQLDPSAVAWIDSEKLEAMQKSNFLSVDTDGSTVIGNDGIKNGQAVIQKAGLDSRQLKNLNTVLVTRGILMRAISPELNAGDLVKVGDKPYLILTAAHLIDTGSLGGATATASKFWLASL